MTKRAEMATKEAQSQKGAKEEKDQAKTTAANRGHPTETPRCPHSRVWVCVSPVSLIFISWWTRRRQERKKEKKGTNWHTTIHTLRRPKRWSRQFHNYLWGPEEEDQTKQRQGLKLKGPTDQIHKIPKATNLRITIVQFLMLILKPNKEQHSFEKRQNGVEGPMGRPAPLESRPGGPWYRGVNRPPQQGNRPRERKNKTSCKQRQIP